MNSKHKLKNKDKKIIILYQNKLKNKDMKKLNVLVKDPLVLYIWSGVIKLSNYML